MAMTFGMHLGHVGGPIADMRKLWRFADANGLREGSEVRLAGVRIGYMIGRKALIAEVNKLRPPFNVSVLNCEAALFALADTPQLSKKKEKLICRTEEITGSRISHGRSANITMWAPSLAAESTESSLEATA